MGAAGVTLVAALLLTARTPSSEPAAATTAGDDGVSLEASLTTSRILGGAHDHNLAVSISMPASKRQVRPSLSVAVVIDRSGSMHGAAMENAKDAASKLIGQLGPSDAFTVIAYSSGDQVIMPMVRATDANKSAARDAIGRIYDDGGTCISCGLERGSAELARSPVADGIRRIVLISDGQANEGLWDRGELVELAAGIADRGVSITAVGVGLDFDELTMQRLADFGRGNYCFVEDTGHLAAMFQQELGGLVETAASDAFLELTDRPGVRIEEAYGYPLARIGNGVRIPISDLRAGETRKVVLRVHIAAAEGALPLADVRFGWRRVRDGAARSATTTATASVVDDARVVADSVVPWAAQAVEEALSARALEEASLVYETDGYESAKRVLEQRVDALRRNRVLAPEVRARIEAVSTEAVESFRAAPPGKATKASRAAAYELAR
ncbi:MAG: VWA domain-containing protein [Kofleriaceae bacterium]|nr:VWA domain-containing protein [Kofleriaceae bacterium]